MLHLISKFKWETETEISILMIINVVFKVNNLLLIVYKIDVYYDSCKITANLLFISKTKEFFDRIAKICDIFLATDCLHSTISSKSPRLLLSSSKSSTNITRPNNNISANNNRTSCSSNCKLHLLIITRKWSKKWIITKKQ